MKRLVLLIVSATMALFLVACGQGEEKKMEEKGAASMQQQQQPANASESMQHSGHTMGAEGGEHPQQ